MSSELANTLPGTGTTIVSMGTTSITANTYFLPGSGTPPITKGFVAPTHVPCLFRIYVAGFSVSAVLTVHRASTVLGQTGVSELLNHGVALTVNSAYMFDILMTAGDTINLTYGSTGSVNTLRIIEIDAQT